MLFAPISLTLMSFFCLFPSLQAKELPTFKDNDFLNEGHKLQIGDDNKKYFLEKLKRDVEVGNTAVFIFIGPKKIDVCYSYRQRWPMIDSNHPLVAECSEGHNAHMLKKICKTGKGRYFGVKLRMRLYCLVAPTQTVAPVATAHTTRAQYSHLSTFWREWDQDGTNGPGQTV